MTELLKDESNFELEKLSPETKGISNPGEVAAGGEQQATDGSGFFDAP